MRATNIQLERLSALLPTFSFLSPDVLDRWNDLQPQGKLEALALDIPLKQPEKSRFQALWRDVSWQRWELLPGVNHFSGALSGGVENGRLTLGLTDSTLPYGDMFRAPLEVSSARGALTWRYNQQGWELASQGWTSRRSRCGSTAIFATSSRQGRSVAEHPGGYPPV